MDHEFDYVSFISDYEAGILDQDEIVEGFVYLLQSGIINHLQGSYQRTALNLINQGLITPQEVEA